MWMGGVKNQRTSKSFVFFILRGFYLLCAYFISGIAYFISGIAYFISGDGSPPFNL